MNLSIHIMIISLVLFVSCGNPKKDKMLEQFNQLHTHVKKGEIDEYHKYLNKESLEFIAKVSDPQNLNEESMRAIGKEYKIDFWCAQYYNLYSHQIATAAENANVFAYLSYTETPLFNFFLDYDLVLEKSRVRDGSNYVVIGEQRGDQRVISWMKYDKEEEDYMFDLINFLQIQEAYGTKRVYHELKKDKPGLSINKLIAEHIDDIYDTPIEHRRMGPKVFDKSQRGSVEYYLN